MIENDTLNLLRECDLGVKMGIKAIEDVAEHIQSRKLKELLNACKDKHSELENDIRLYLKKYNESGKEPPLLTKGVSSIKTNIKLHKDESDSTIADLMTDGCNMGIKSLNKYLNRYKAADESSKDIAKRLINIEEKLVIDIRSFL